MYKLHVIGVVLVIVWNSYLGFTQDIGFPEEEPVVEFANKDKRHPVYIPGKCSPNELYYPGDQKDDWICDCAPGFIYYPSADRCYAAYRQGPCQSGDYLILPKGKVIPECNKNPCKRDQYVQLNDICHQIGKPEGPCPPISQGGGTVGVDVSTLKIDCLKPNPDGGNDLSLFKVPPKDCPPGSKRSTSGKCREVA